MKKALLYFLLFSGILFFTGCDRKNVEPDDMLSRVRFRNNIVIGIKDDSKPFGFVQNGEITGFDADVAKEIVKKILGDNKKSCYTFVAVTPESRIADLNSKKVDIVIATMSINSKRASVVDFTIPYFVAGQAIMIPKDSKIYSIEDLNYKKVVVILGTTGEKTIRQLAPYATVLGKKNYNDAFELLKNGTVQAILADDSILYGFLPDNKGYKILPQRYTREYYAVALRKGKENELLKKELNKILENMQQSGKLNRIKEKWIPNLHTIK